MKLNRKTLIAAALFAFAVISLAPLAGCKASLQPGGAYAPTNAIGAALVAPDQAFYQVDAAFLLAYGTIDGALKFELNNRAYLWVLSPNIKHTLDKVRPDFVLAVQEYGVAREAYMANPTAAGLTALQTVLSKAQALAAAAGAVTANLPVKGN